MDHGCREFIVGLGGSATTDGGRGLLEALGARLLTSRSEPLPVGTAALADLGSVDLSDLDPRLADCTFTLAVDVDNPLLGEHGAAAVFGPQKGLDATGVETADRALARWADVLEAATGRASRDLPGAGAAGGIAAGMVSALGATIRSGIEAVAELLDLESVLRECDLVLGGEGSIDSQSARGKTVHGLARVAGRAEVPMIAFGGRVAPDVAAADFGESVVALVPIVRGPTTLERALAEGPANLRAATAMAVQLFARDPGGRNHDEA